MARRNESPRVATFFDEGSDVPQRQLSRNVLPVLNIPSTPMTGVSPGNKSSTEWGNVKRLLEGTACSGRLLGALVSRSGELADWLQTLEGLLSSEGMLAASSRLSLKDANGERRSVHPPCRTSEMVCKSNTAS